MIILPNLPNKEKLQHNFSRCGNWEEIYLYIIELGDKLSPIPVSMRTKENVVIGCQSSVWIFIKKYEKNVYFYGDSDAKIVKGLLAIVFILYQKLTFTEIIYYDVQKFFNKLEFNQHLTLYRLHGLEAIVRNIRAQIRSQI